MKGVVFTEFIEMVEQQYSPRLVDELLDSLPSASHGAYTSVGTYPHKELLALVDALSHRSGAAASELLRAFGRRLLGRFADRYPQYFRNIDTFQLLEHVDEVIQREVRKLYPDAELPSFTTQRDGSGGLVLHYTSSRPFQDLALGLIDGAIAHFGESIDVAMSATPKGARFVLTKNAEAPACLN